MVGVDYDLIRRIGSNITASRERAGMTVDQVAKPLGLSSELLQDFENGLERAFIELDLRSFLRIARLVGAPAELILRGG